MVTSTLLFLTSKLEATKEGHEKKIFVILTLAFASATMDGAQMSILVGHSLLLLRLRAAALTRLHHTIQ